MHPIIKKKKKLDHNIHSLKFFLSAIYTEYDNTVSISHSICQAHQNLKWESVVNFAGCGFFPPPVCVNACM